MGFVEISLQLLFLLFCLSILGEPLRIVIRKFSGLFKNLDVLQILVLDVYLGGFLLYVIAIVPLQLFGAITLYAITLMSIVVVFFFYRKGIVRSVQNLPLYSKSPFRMRIHSETILVVLVFLFSLGVQTSPFSSLLFGSVRDTGIYSLFVQVIIENKQIPMTLKPYLNEGIVYPQGFTPIAAYSVFLLNYLPPQSVLYVTALFNALVILGAYFLGKTLCGKWMGLSLTFMFAFVSSLPKYITWGSNALVASFPLFFICLSFLPFLLKGKPNVRVIMAIGLLFGYLAVFHLQVYEMLILALFVFWLYMALRRMSSWGTLFFFVAISGISLLILSPFLYRALVFYSYPYHNIGIPSDVEIALPQVEPNAILSSANSVFQRLAVNDVLRVASLILFFVSASVIVRFRRKGSFNQAIELVKVGTAALLGELLLFLLSAISPNDLPFYPQPLLLYFPLYFFLAVFNFTSYKFLSSFLSEKVFVKILNHKPRKKFLAASLSSMLLLVIYAPFLYQAIALDGQMLYGSYAVYAVTTEHDFRLLLWMRENFTRDATILIDNFQSGSFIPSIADCKAVFPSFGSSYSISYQRLVALIEGRAINTTVYDLMKSFNVTHIYVGEGVSPVDNWKHRWEPKLFLGNPNFHLVKNYGDAYLFRLDYVKPNIVFLDDFEYASWNQNGWQTNFLGNGLGNVTITANLGYNDSKSLKITAQVVPTEAEMKYARWVGREILVANNSRVSLSFYFNATQGFNGDDTFAALVSNVYRNQSMVITTSNGIYRNYRYAIPLNASQGFFEERDLTAAWHRMFNSSLPNPFILEFVNWDFDGVKNVAYLDNVTITSTPDA